MAKNSFITIRGAREHNLKGIDIELPRDQLVVITGPSGSGKSSLAFDTIYAEGQRRYVESLSAYARQFLGQNSKPDVDSIDGLSPAIAIEQKSSANNPRSTVGTLTEVYDYLRLLYARAGQPHCYQCGQPIQAQTVQQMVDSILALPDGSRFLVLAPLVRGRKGEYRRDLEQLRKEGFVRVRVDGEVRDLAEDITLDKHKRHDIEVVIDRLVLRAGIKQRLTDSVELALRKAGGLLAIQLIDGAEHKFSERHGCDACGISNPELEPRLFSFNSPFGACQTCDGLGHGMKWDLSKVIPDPSKSLAQGAIRPWVTRTGLGGYYLHQSLSVAKAYKKSPNTPWNKLSKDFQQIILNGSGERAIAFSFESDGSEFKFKRPFEGLLPQLQRRFTESSSEQVRSDLETYLSRKPCADCGGKRLRQEAQAVRVNGVGIVEVCAKPIPEARKFMQGLDLGAQQGIAAPIVREVDARLSFLESVGLDYLSLERASNSLSGGEAQRIRLATQIGSALRGVIYVLDEPSIGLHQRDNERLLSTLKHLRDLGNTVLVVEHDEDTIRAADYVVDMGPGAGVLGGQVVVAGTPEKVRRTKNSLTGQYLSGRMHIPVPRQRREGNGLALMVHGARGNNLRGVDARFPLGTFICVTGVSGSGKSTLVNDTLLTALARQLNGAKDDPAPHDKIDGMEHIDKFIGIDQSPIGRTPRSNPATYTQLFTPLRELFAGLPDSRSRGYGPGRFSFNVKGGRCEACEGDGLIRVEMHFLPDVYVTCEQCKGRRYNRETLEVLFKGKNVADILEMTVDEAADFLTAIPNIAGKLKTLQAVGLGYVHLGQSATTLSGGEAQRIKLARELSKRSTGRTLYILDEPTTGLHFADVHKLLTVLDTLADGGNTVLVIEHNLDVIKSADYIIDLGPEGGSGGGEIIASGTPEQISAVGASHTGRYLLPMLQAAGHVRATTAADVKLADRSNVTKSASPRRANAR